MRGCLCLALVLLASVSSADQFSELNPPILTPHEAIDRFKEKMTDKEDTSFDNHVLAVVAFSYTDQHWIIHFDCDTDHPEWKEEDCGIHSYLVNNENSSLVPTRNK